MNATTITAAAALFALAAGAAHAQTLVFDRGLPDANLNNAANANRSNVAWGYGQSGSPFTTGDDFTLGATGDATNTVWRVDTIRMWIIAGAAGDSGFDLSQRYNDAQLYVKNGAAATTLAQSGNFIAGSNNTDNADISISAVQYAGGQDYQTTTGPLAQVWQIDFTNLNLIVNPGDAVEFYAFGEAIDPASGVWFNLASNAALSGTTQDGADDLYRFLQVDNFANTGAVDSNGNGWDKSSDLNVQVFATAVPAPGAAAVLGLAGLLAGRRRR
ncbi:MAG: hypothetical protein AAF356_11300 [Planctomycetota bacterium]